MNRPVPLRPCPRCGRHHRADEAACPFCGHRPARLGGLPGTLAACLSVFVLMACYGAPPNEDGDEDADGFTPAEGDCDDFDAAVNPDATEICDDLIDNDCDGLIDADDSDCAGG